MKKTILIAGMVLAFGLADSIAQAPATGDGGNRGMRGGRGGNQLMTALDRNGDGELDSREIQQAAVSLRSLDTNKDFKLSAEELGTRRRGTRGDMTERFMEMDANKDGKLGSNEVPERMQRFMQQMDSDGDGAVDKAEMETFQNEMRRRFEEGGGRPPRGDRGNQGGSEEN